MLSLYWFATSVLWTAILITTLPSQAYAIGGDATKGRTLGVILLVGAFVSMVVAPLFGAISDRLITRWGRRRPWLVLGTLLSLIGLVGLAYFPHANDLSSLSRRCVVVKRHRGRRQACDPAAALDHAPARLVLRHTCGDGVSAAAASGWQ